MRSAVKLTLLILMGFAITACATKVQKNNFADLTFNHVDQIKLDVAEIQIKQAYQSPMVEPYVDHEMPISLMKAATRWSNDVLQASGTSGIAVVTISEASVQEEMLEKTGGFTGTFTTDQSERYTAKLTLEIRVTDQSGASANTSAGVSRSMTVPEDIKLVDREKAWFTLIEKTTNDMNLKMQENSKKFLKSYLVQ